MNPFKRPYWAAPLRGEKTPEAATFLEECGLDVAGLMAPFSSSYKEKLEYSEVLEAVMQMHSGSGQAIAKDVMNAQPLPRL